MHSERNQRNSGGRRNCNSLSTAAAAGSAATTAASGGSGGDGGGSDDGSGGCGGNYKSPKYIHPWRRDTWSNSEQGSHIKSVASAHIHCRGADYVQLKIDGEMRWISVHSSGYKFNTWTVKNKPAIL